MGMGLAEELGAGRQVSLATATAQLQDPVLRARLEMRLAVAPEGLTEITRADLLDLLTHLD